MFPFDQNFLNTFYSLDKTLDSDTCYAVNQEWWGNLEFFIGLKLENPDAFETWNEELNNKELLDMSFDSIKIEETSNFNLSHAINKENEKTIYPLKKSLKYGRDFIFVNPDVWNFIKKYFKAGPTIKYFVLTSLFSSMSSITHNEEPSLPLNRFIPLNFAKVKVYFKDSGQKITKSLVLPVFEGMSYEQMGKVMMSGLKLTPNNQHLLDLRQNREILIKENESAVPQENKLYLISDRLEEGGRQDEEQKEVVRKKKEEEEEEEEEEKGGENNVKKEEEGKRKEEEGRRKEEDGDKWEEEGWRKEEEIKKKEDEGKKKREDGKKREVEVVRKEEEGKRKEEEGRESVEDEYTSMRNEHSAKTASTERNDALVNFRDLEEDQNCSVDAEKLRERARVAQSEKPRIALKQKSLMEIKKNLSKLMREYNFKKIKVKPVGK